MEGKIYIDLSVANHIELLSSSAIVFFTLWGHSLAGWAGLYRHDYLITELNWSTKCINDVLQQITVPPLVPTSPDPAE